MKRQLAAVFLAVTFVAAMSWLNQQAIKNAGTFPRHPNGPHPEQVDPSYPFVVCPEAVAEMEKTIRINGHYVVTTASWRHME